MHRITDGLMPLLVAGLLVAVACGDDPIMPEPVPEGTMSATLDGAISERYEVEGSYPGPHAGRAETFAVARRGPQPGSFTVLGLRARDPDLQDALLVELDGATQAGVYPLEDGILNYGQVDTSVPRSFEITSGEVTLTSVSDDHLRGTFTATAVEVPPPFGAAPDTVHISDGEFSVPVVTF